MSVFYQTERWETRDGADMFLEDMEHGHRANLLRYIWRNIEYIRMKLLTYWDIEIVQHDGGEVAPDTLEMEAEYVELAPAEHLFNSLPLVKRLRELTPNVRDIPDA